MIEIDPAHQWRVHEISSRLAVSESSLRRRLQHEGIGFRDILEEVRLAMGLGMVMGTSLMIIQIADSCGYQSQSRFTERFKIRYGISPSELRKTQTNKNTATATSRVTY